MKLIYGVGYNDRTYPAAENKKSVREYDLWHSMLTRCYSGGFKRINAAYEGCTVSENFKSYSYFYEWCQRQIGFNEKEWQLDKDLLFKGNKQYSEDTCVFVPQSINKTLPFCQKRGLRHAVGVSYHTKKRKYVVQPQLQQDGSRRWLGAYDTEVEAFQVYKVYKERHLKNLAKSYYGRLDKRAYSALMAWEVDMSD